MDYTNHLAPVFFICLLILHNNTPCQAQLSFNFYDTKCPNAISAIKNTIRTAVVFDRRMAASLLRLQFHDCFVQGCDASILLNETPKFKSEKNASPNKNSVRGYEVIEAAKSEVEKLCPGVVSCADIVVLAARDASEAVGGPSWSMGLGRRDSTTANAALADETLPGPSSSVNDLISTFSPKGFSTRDVVALSGAHTVGQAQCRFFRNRIHKNGSDIDPGFANTRKNGCPKSSGDRNLAPLDVSTPGNFDNKYYKNLIEKKGLLNSDQVLMGDDSTRSIVTEYNANPVKFQSDFAAAMVKMSSLSPLTGQEGVIRKTCRALP